MNVTKLTYILPPHPKILSTPSLYDTVHCQPSAETPPPPPPSYANVISVSSWASGDVCCQRLFVAICSGDVCCQQMFVAVVKLNFAALNTLWYVCDLKEIRMLMCSASERVLV